MSEFNYTYSRENLGALMNTLRADNSISSTKFGIVLLGHLACLRVTLFHHDGNEYDIRATLRDLPESFITRKIYVKEQRLEIDTDKKEHKLVYCIPLCPRDPLEQVSKIKEAIRAVRRSRASNPTGIENLIDTAVVTTESYARSVYRYVLSELFNLENTLLSQYSDTQSESLLNILSDAIIIPSNKTTLVHTADFYTMISGMYTNILLTSAVNNTGITIPYATIRNDQLFVSAIPGVEPVLVSDGDLARLLNQGEQYVKHIASYT